MRRGTLRLPLNSAQRPLVLLLAFASLLRVILVVQGGQLYWPDERLYRQVLDIFDLHRGDWFAITKSLFATQDHLGFALISAPAAALQFSIGHALSRSADGLVVLPGLLLAQASVVSIALIHAIARRMGGDRVEALLAAALMASATTMFYYARHLLPYDSAMMLALLALWFGVGATRRDSLACGAAAAAAFVTYNGYWLIAGVVLLLHIARQGGTTVGSALRRALYAALGFAIVPAIVVLVEVATGAPLLFGGMRRLAGTVTEGYAPEGFTLPWAYLWHAEHGLLFVWMGALLFVVLARDRTSARRRTAMTWALAVVSIYLGLGVASAILHVFVVMGRQARQMVPFFCLATAAVLMELRERRLWSPRVAAVCIAALVLQAAWNFRVPLQQRFPRDVIAEITSKYGPIDFDNTIQGPPEAHEHVESQWVLFNAQHLYHPRAPRPAFAPARFGEAGRLPPGLLEVMRFRHPLQFLPYQYEGFEPMERQVLRANDIAMRLVDVGAPVDRLP